MDHLATLSVFIQAAETGSFVGAGRNIGMTASGVGKAVVRLENRLGVRLFNRNTRKMTLTEEGRSFLERCRKVFEELNAAELELTQSAAAPTGRLRLSLPLIAPLLMPVISRFMSAYPSVLLEIHSTDRLVDVIDEGFDVAIRTGEGVDSTLMSRGLGRFNGVLVASPDYLKRRGTPFSPEELLHHDCLRHRSPSSGRLHDWALRAHVAERVLMIPESMSSTTLDPLVHLAERGFGIAFLPPFAVSSQLVSGSLVSILEDFVLETGELAAVWPSNRHLSPRIRAFVAFLTEHLRLDEFSSTYDSALTRS